MTSITETLNHNCVDVKFETPYIYLADVSDIHIGNENVDTYELKRAIQKIKETPNFYVIVGGDSTDNSSTNSASSVFDENAHGNEQIEECVQLLRPIKDRILFIRTGNHGYQRAKRYNNIIPEQIIAYMLDIACLQGCATAFIRVKDSLYVVSAWHNSKKPNKMEWLHTDSTFYEHLHLNEIQRTVYIEPNRFCRQWVEHEHYDIQSVGFLKYGGYASEKGYKPSIVGCPVVRLNGTVCNI